MFDYFQEFNKLPKEIRDKVSSPKVMADIDSLERKYKVELASFVMKTMTKKIPVDNLALYLTSLLKIRREAALNLEKELLDKVFLNVKEYLKDVKKDILTEKNNDVAEKEKSKDFSETKKEVKDSIRKEDKKKDIFTKEISKNILDNSLSYKKNTEINKSKNIIEEKQKVKSLHDGLLKNKNQFRTDPALGSLEKKKEEQVKEKQINDDLNKKDLYNIKANRFATKEVKKDEKNVDNVKVKVEKVLKEIDVSLSSAHLMSRFKFILGLYIKGVRNKVSTRSAFSRSPNEGGLGLDQVTVDKIFSMVNSFSKEDKKLASTISREEKSKLDSLNDTYDFKKVIAKKEEQLKAKEEGKLLDTVKSLNKVVPKLSPPPPTVVKNEQKSKKEGQIKSELASGALNKKNLPGISLDDSLGLIGEEKEGKMDKDKLDEKIAESKIQKKEDEVIKEDEVVKEEKKKFSLFHNKKNKAEKEILDVNKNESKKIDFDKKLASSEREFGKKISEKDKKGGDEFNKIFEDKSGEKEIINFDSEKIKKENNKVKFNPKPSTNKPRLDDIKVVDRFMGPVDELKNIDLIDFRRLGKTCDDRINKIKDKLNLLEADSYDKMILGIEAWRKNPLNILYRNITIDSINKSIPITEVIAQREKNDQDTLNLEELHSLIAFNREITF